MGQSVTQLLVRLSAKPTVQVGLQVLPDVYEKYPSGHHFTQFPESGSEK